MYIHANQRRALIGLTAWPQNIQTTRAAAVIRSLLYYGYHGGHVAGKYPYCSAASAWQSALDVVHIQALLTYDDCPH